MEKEKRKTKRKEQGITLIALVITIIVLLILAGVSIAMLTGENGILTQAQRAKNETKNAANEENQTLDDISTKIDILTQGKPTYNDEMKTLKQGDYVIYDTGVAETGEVVCRVLYDANSEYGLQIITDDCIKENGEYLPIFLGGDDYTALESYNNAIKTLNEKAMKYLNENFVLDARCVGTNPKNKEAESEEFAEYEGKKYPVKAEDKNYETDYDMLNKLNILNIEVPYWLASRYTEYGRVYFVNGIICYIRMIGQEMEAIYKVEEGYSIENTVANALRPVFTLRGDLTIASGDGQSEATAYRFN